MHSRVSKQNRAYDINFSILPFVIIKKKLLKSEEIT